MSEVTTETPDAGDVALDNGQPQEESVSISSSLSQEYMEHPSMQKFKVDNGEVDINKISKSYLSLESMMGQNKVPVPKDNEDMQAWELYDKAFGVPAKPEEYKLENEHIQSESLDEFRGLMKRLHIPESSAQELLNNYVNGMISDQKAREEQFNQDRIDAESSLKEEWGMKYNENMKKANKYLEQMSGNKEDYDYFLEKTGNDPRFIKLFARMGDEVSEGSLGGFEGQSTGFTRTPKEAKAELDRIMNDPSDAYWAGARNQRNNMKWAKENNQSYVSEEERKARVAYVQSLMQMAG